MRNLWWAWMLGAVLLVGCSNDCPTRPNPAPNPTPCDSTEHDDDDDDKEHERSPKGGK